MMKQLFPICLLVFLAFLQQSPPIKAGLLYPKSSETRETISLDGIWNFVASPLTDPLVGFRNYWYKRRLTAVRPENKSKIGIIFAITPINFFQVDAEVHFMPVPSSYNDITQNAAIRDHLGIAWYDRTFFVPKSWRNQRVWLRFSSVHYAAQIVITPVDTDNGTTYRQSYTFDFFNYAGIHRPVTLYTTPKSYIDDVTIKTTLDENGYGYVGYNVSIISLNETEELNVNIALLDKDDIIVATAEGSNGVLNIESPRLWWPYLMDPEPGYLYTLKIELVSLNNDLIDIYRQTCGIRTLTWTNTTFLINNKPVYLHGFGRHEDADIRGKGLDLPTTLRDYNLIKWIGANAYRTSHYPYADEIMDLADNLGIMIIDECPSVNTEFFPSSLLNNHLNSLTELIARDKNRPSVIAWSIANEPRTQSYEAGVYFGKVAAHVRSLDLSRPITIALARSVYEDRAGQHLDIISFNRYNAWYQNGGQLDMITKNVINEATAWFEKYNKPVLMSEYGADTMEGLHIYPEFIWSEEFQVTLMSKHFEAFDKLRAKGFFIGEFIWNFADFKTAQTYTRVGGNKKGIFTRNRQPKASAHHLRRRYLKLAQELYNIDLPNDLYDYTSTKIVRDEL
ncbi:beta-glucuronidase [Holotrichia oblita]|uniref:Beta-glucuronidase n=1 Tax=Holotrichia oblita TaxID=644536 RepID=A0ACB9SL64_HOLOL|nr:beta-glucuronidase [Holotrichia oblita]